ncbi:MAG: LysM peptidoglycan-binding domain-containing M23 family metallopeptidase [Candidatus Omnitrophica bacterium]|nr:LysM peptidoglycan-binding domain-containing M23 family metallopeptidase [Candidatus Omnitrophota bacterium]
MILLAQGCATVRKPETSAIAPVAKETKGFSHKVKRGETLWRISRIYGVDIDRIAEANNIQDVTQLEVGQSIVIPGVSKPAISFAGIPGEDFLWPLRGSVAVPFGHMSNGRANKGIDIKFGRDKDISASRSGTVVFSSGDFLDFGRTVIIDHGDGYFTVYAKDIDLLVKPGDVVQRGAKIAQAAPSADSSGAYMHFEIRKGAVSQNPHLYLSD